MDRPQSEAKPSAALPDFEELSLNMARFVEEAGKAAAAYLKARDGQPRDSFLAEEVGEGVRTLALVAQAWLADPARALEAQTRLTSKFMELWLRSLLRAQGVAVPPAAEPAPRDRRFQDPDWAANPIFDFVKQAYLITTQWAEGLVEDAQGLDDHTRLKARFYVRQLSSALAPSNFLATNPELIRETIQENGANLVRGMRMLAEDVAAGRGSLKIRQTDASRFTVGVNMANTPGKVIFRNDLMELIQYAPTTETVLRRPLLIVPPWINKFYILDLNRDKSFIRWAVAQGLTVFCISWINPDERHAQKGFEHYMREGIFAALDCIDEATGERTVTAIGYCVGGTLLAVTLAYMAAQKDRRIESATLFTTQVDFEHAGDLKVFADENQIRVIEHAMQGHGYLDGSRMATAFNMLRPDDLIWSYWVNVYQKGHPPFPFDLLYWNSDSTRMPAANHSFYLRNCYLGNKLTQGEMELDSVKLDLKKVRIPIFNLATREDHIAPARSVFEGSKAFGGPVQFVLAGSGHIAGVVNPADRPKYQFWTNGPVTGELEDWLARAEEHAGSWWPYWFDWIERQAPRHVKARVPGGGKLEPLCDAPGTYVTMRA